MKFLLIFFILTVVVFSISNAEVATRGGSNDQSQALIQQLGAERTRLTAENAKLKKQLKDIQSELDEIKQKSESTSKQLSAVKGQLNSKSELSNRLTESLENAKQKLNELIAKFKETALSLRNAEHESAQRAQEIARLERELNTCATNNVALSKLGFEVLENYENKGFWARAGQKEPFTQLKKVQIENLVDEYTYLIQDQEYKAPIDLE